MNIQEDQIALAGGSVDEALIHLGTWLGRHQAFGMIANRCSAADAECLRNLRESGQYKRLGLTWEQFCSQRAGISRAHADRLIRRLEEFGANYFRLSELMEISPETYRLIAGSVSDAGIQVNGETIPIAPDNRDKLAAAVESARKQAKSEPAQVLKVAALRKLLTAFLDGATAVSRTESQRAELIVLLEERTRQIGTLSEGVRRNTLVQR